MQVPAIRQTTAPAAPVASKWEAPPRRRGAGSREGNPAAVPVSRRHPMPAAPIRRHQAGNPVWSVARVEAKPALRSLAPARRAVRRLQRKVKKHRGAISLADPATGSRTRPAEPPASAAQTERTQLVLLGCIQGRALIQRRAARAVNPPARREMAARLLRRNWGKGREPGKRQVKGRGRGKAGRPADKVRVRLPRARRGLVAIRAALPAGWVQGLTARQWPDLKPTQPR